MHRIDYRAALLVALPILAMLTPRLVLAQGGPPLVTDEAGRGRQTVLALAGDAPGWNVYAGAQLHL